MKYPKPIMRLTELRDVMGFPEEMLLRAYRERGQTFAAKTSPKRNSPIIFDTEGLEKWRLKQIRLQEASR